MFGDLNIHPFHQLIGCIETPVHFADDGLLYQLWDNEVVSADFKYFLNKKTTGIQVYNFHPIHVFLNSENLYRYEQTRQMHMKPLELIKNRFSGFGARHWLMQTLGLENKMETNFHVDD